MMNVIDITALSEIAKSRGIWLIVDNTFLSPYFQNPLDLGADIVVHSGTKYLGVTMIHLRISGYSDISISEKLRFVIKPQEQGLHHLTVG